MARKRSELPENIRNLVPPKATMNEVMQAEQLYDSGVKAGIILSHGKVLGLLEEKYMSEEAPKRGTPEAIAILELAKVVGEHLRLEMEELQK